MSGSKQKEIRRQQREEGVEKHQVARKEAFQKEKKHKITITVVSIVAALLVVVLVLFSSNLFYHNFDAVKIGDTTYNASELSFFYRSSYSNFMQTYGQYFGPDTTKPLSSQKYTEDQTWADFFREMAVAQMKEITILYEEAGKAGFELSEEDRTAMDEELASLETLAQTNNFPNVDAFLASGYGKGVNYDLVAGIMEKVYVANAYRTQVTDSYTYTDADLLAYYNENKDNYDKYSFVSYFAEGKEDTEAGIDAETAMKDAKEKADSVIDDTDSQDDFIAKVTAVSGTAPSVTNQATAAINTVYKDWVTDSSRKAGDMTVIEGESGYYAVYWLAFEDNNYPTLSVRHILINVEAEEQTEEEIAANTPKVYTDEAKEAALKKAEDILARWEDGDATEDSFAELANELSEDPGSNEKGGLYEGVYKGQMVTEFNDWCFDSERKPGDTGIVFNEGNYCGYHVIFFVGDDGNDYRTVMVKDDIRNADYSKWFDSIAENYTETLGFTAKLVK